MGKRDRPWGIYLICSTTWESAIASHVHLLSIWWGPLLLSDKYRRLIPLCRAAVLLLYFLIWVLIPFFEHCPQICVHLVHIFNIQYCYFKQEICLFPLLASAMQHLASLVGTYGKHQSVLDKAREVLIFHIPFLIFHIRYLMLGAVS
jgi:hypothetical protein